MTRSTLDWTKIWAECDAWYEQACHVRKSCKHCGHEDRDYPEWEDQQKAIQRIVNKHFHRAIERTKE